MMELISERANLPLPPMPRITWKRAALDAVLWLAGAITFAVLVEMLVVMLVKMLLPIWFDAFEIMTYVDLWAVAAMAMLTGTVIATILAGWLRRSWRPVVMILAFGFVLFVALVILMAYMYFSRFSWNSSR